MNNSSEYKPVQGETYSLFANYNGTEIFYNKAEGLLDWFLKNGFSENLLLEKIQNSLKSKKYFQKWIIENPVIKEKFLTFAEHTTAIESHLKRLSVFKIFDKTMKLKEWQYHVFMLEFVIINRINLNKFSSCDLKIALLPHCLREFIPDCKAIKKDLDYVCKNCVKSCYINRISKVLRKQKIDPYIWMSINLKSLIKKVRLEGKTLGILGIACLPELVGGMHTCLKTGIPVIGIPLDANRCQRWMGKFHPNSINLERLEKLITNEKQDND